MSRRRVRVRLSADRDVVSSMIRRGSDRAEAIRAELVRRFNVDTLIGVTTLLGDRPDLRGVLPLADILDEHVRWLA